MDNVQVTSINNLPEHLIAEIISYLPLYDVRNCTKVCRYWENVCSWTNVWKYAPFDVRLFPLELLSTVPYIHTVTGEYNYGDTLLNALVMYAADIRKLDCRVSENPSVAIFREFSEKFRNLQSLTVNLSLVEPQILNILGSFPNLNALKINCDSNVEQQKLEDCVVHTEQFSKLKKLEIYGPEINNKGKQFISELVSKLLPQITHLQISFSFIFTPILKLIVNSVSLEHLKISITDLPVEINLDFHNMSNLKYFTLFIGHHFLPDDNSALYSLYNSMILPDTVEYLHIEMENTSNLSSNFFTNAINYCKNLRSLSAVNVHDPLLDFQLCNINTLTNLSSVSFISCQSFTFFGLYHVLHCKYLTQLKISDVCFSYQTYNSIKLCKYLCDFELNSCSFNVNKFIESIRNLLRLCNLKLNWCKKDFDESVIVNSEASNLLQQCRHFNYNLKIICLPENL